MIIVSGLSGAGKTVALHTLEDLGYYCIDNLPISLLPALYEEQKNISQPVAVGIDVRSHNDGIGEIPDVIQRWKSQDEDTRVLFLTASPEMLIKRFSESRRKHPLSGTDIPLADAVSTEMRVLSPLIAGADYQIDTSKINIYELKQRISQWLKLSKDRDRDTTITIESFGFKHGVPYDADLMFDVRFFPNPHWDVDLREFTGQDPEIQAYLSQSSDCSDFISDTVNYLSRWIPSYLESYRRYLTIAVGCTGGKHRSVYTAEHIARALAKELGPINVRHRDLPVDSQQSK